MKSVDTNILVRYYAQDYVLHLAASAACSAFLTFDDRKFVRLAQRLNLKPVCVIPI